MFFFFLPNFIFKTIFSFIFKTVYPINVTCTSFHIIHLNKYYDENLHVIRKRKAALHEHHNTKIYDKTTNREKYSHIGLLVIVV